MRLFIAINFSPSFKKAILSSAQQLRNCGVRGNFTREENLHLTLAFIGESDRVNDIRGVLDSIDCAPFDISLGNHGSFGNLLWIGLDKSDKLLNLANGIRKKLLDLSFDIDTKPFRPHITVVREASENVDFDIPACSMTVSRVSLMRSDRINGKLVYKEVYGKTLI